MKTKVEEERLKAQAEAKKTEEERLKLTRRRRGRTSSVALPLLHQLHAPFAAAVSKLSPLPA